MSGSSQSTDAIHAAWRSFEATWSAVRAGWLDEVGNRFEREFVVRWQERTAALLAATEEVERAIGEADRHL